MRESGTANERVHRSAEGRLKKVACICLVMMFGLGCRRTNRLPEWLDNVDLSALRVEAAAFAREAEKNGQWYWGGKNSNLPQTIKSIAPLSVTLHTNPPPVALEIAKRSGFFHQGLLINCDTNNPGGIPNLGNNWRIYRISDAICEYKE